VLDSEIFPHCREISLDRALPTDKFVAIGARWIQRNREKSAASGLAFDLLPEHACDD
jgi:hypothetical protein